MMDGHLDNLMIGQMELNITMRFLLRWMQLNLIMMDTILFGPVLMANVLILIVITITMFQETFYAVKKLDIIKELTKLILVLYKEQICVIQQVQVKYTLLVFGGLQTKKIMLKKIYREEKQLSFNFSLFLLIRHGLNTKLVTQLLSGPLILILTGKTINKLKQYGPMLNKMFLFVFLFRF